MKTSIPIKSTGIAVILLKRIAGIHHVLLLKRASAVLNDVWCYIGGGIEAGESAWEAALREVKEETGITELSLYNSGTFDQFYNAEKNYIYLAPVFVGFIKEETAVQLNDEHRACEWVSFEDALNIVTVPGNEQVLAFIKKHFADKEPEPWLKIETKES